MNISELSLESKDLDVPANDTRRIRILPFKDPGVRHFDFVVDNQSLSEKVRRGDVNAPIISTMLQSNMLPKYQLEYIERLLGEKEPDMPSGRVALYVCPFDGDPACDNVGCRIEFTDDTVKWSDFAWDANFGDDDEEVVGDEDDEPVKGLTEYTFDLTAYRKLLNDQRQRLQDAGM